jgi:hypothetical protein
MGYGAISSNTTGQGNVGIGYLALNLSTASNTTAVGYFALQANTTGANNTALGFQALGSNTTASNNTAVGYQAGYSNTTGANNTAVGLQSLYLNSTGASLAAHGVEALYSNTTGSFNAAFGRQALYSNTTASNNTAVGYQAGYSNTTGQYQLFLGFQSGYGVTTGTNNTFVGHLSGESMTTGNKNVILGRYSGNYGGLDIRTANNYIVLSDGDGNPRAFADSSGNWGLGGAAPTGQRLYVTGGQIWHNLNQFNVSPGASTDYEMVNRDGRGWLFYTNAASNFGANITQYGVGLGNSFGSSGLGITFPATQNASSNANTLDDYEEGDWTPSYTGTSGDPTVSYTTRTAKYVKIGKQVTAWCYVYISTTTGGGGNIYLSGLPFTCTGVQGGAFNNWSNNGWTTQAPQVGHIPTGQTYVMLTYYIATGTAQVPVANLANGCELTLCMTYQTD